MGKLGKPQRSKKHKKIKNVDYVDEDYEKTRVRPHTNMAPRLEDAQEIPRKLQFFISKKGDFKNVKRKRKKAEPKIDDIQQFRVERGMSKPMKSVPSFVKRKKEQDQAFMNRVENETRRVLLKSQLSDRYKVDFEELEKGQVSVKKKRMSEKKKSRLKAKKAKQREQQKNYVEDRKGDFAKYQDEVRFGEVVDAPPALTAKPRKAPKENKIQRPGRKSLLLKEIIAGNADSSPANVGGTGKRELGQTLKRKNMSMAQQVKLDAEREKAIHLYRQNKKLKIT